MPIVYRFEHPTDNKGPYTSEHAVRYKDVPMHNSLSGHPDPCDDYDLDDNNSRGYTMGDPDDRSAFLSLKQASKWFCKAWVREMQLAGFKLCMYKADVLWSSENQAVVSAKSMELLAFTDIPSHKQIEESFQS